MLDPDEGFNFELVLARVQSQKNVYDDQDRVVLNEAVFTAYEKIDPILERATETANPLSGPDNRTTVAFLNAFWGDDPSLSSFVFTLNQDTPVERVLRKHDLSTDYFRPAIPPSILGKSVTTSNNQTRFETRTPSSGMVVHALSHTPEEGWPSLAKGPKYVKMHGSWDWSRPDGNRELVLGGGKYKQIKQNPLFSFYQEAFEAFLWSGGKRLCVLGYGFGDEHINRVIIKAVIEHGLRVHIWDTLPPDEWRKRNASREPRGRHASASAWHRPARKRLGCPMRLHEQRFHVGSVKPGQVS